jgi:hypothetical protein
MYGGIENTKDLDTDWHFYALSFDGKILRAYVDEKEIGKIDSYPGEITNHPLRIGAQSKSLMRYWNGKIDEVFVFNRALSKDEIAKIRSSNDN